VRRIDIPRAFARIDGTNADYRGPGADTTDPLISTSSEGVRDFVLRRTVWEARRLGKPVELTTAGDHGEHRILVTPEGQVTTTDGSDVEEFVELFAGSSAPIEEIHASPRSTRPARATRSARSAPLPHLTGAPAVSRDSFIDPEPEATPVGLIGTLTRMGAPIKPTARQLRHLENVRVTSQHWAGCRSIAVVNGKGGVGKTMTSAMLAAVFARNGGGSVLAWDNNDTRGTLGWRTETSPHEATVTDAVAAAPRLLAAAASTADVAAYVHHQAEDRYDVLRSNPHLLAADQRIGQAEFDQLMQVAARYYRLVIFDSGNDESADRWLRMIDSTHQLVVPTLAGPESAESAALLLEALTERDERSAALAQDAIVIVTESERGSAAETRRMATAFESLVRAVAVIPFDPALKSGPLRFDTLRPTTQRAWVATGAAVAAGLR
jgi:MinD-like ATPase involved in chromosome partitioning or flagellar assembly